MDPEGRSLLQVNTGDAIEADAMFTVLLGDEVAPRRRFIEDNALNVRNLDVQAVRALRPYSRTLPGIDLWIR